ncbi:COG2426 family protein [Serpentinicella alkaliphila]|uniref:Putative membrane protein n=1 Tax=Serpentinicella alkaliphila TaxID=1734049 RepID=A0A4R2TIZ4_9FIRM|nr:small multi-drug export protein [Serpentinicella alkaliphila]QUH24934.1 small multi-drug export protein [Serpentinicella alkaliphila]TCQ02736.1 putative membrane protein [Serpentinicella alkaliphila]
METLFELINKELLIILIAAMPLMELRAAIPIGVSLGMNPIHATILSIIGSILPVPFLLMLIKPIANYFKKVRLFKFFINKAVRRTLRKSDRIKKYKVIGLMLFVAVPLPTTGVYSGCLAAILFNIPFKYAFPAIAIGTSIAGLGMFILSYVVVNLW